MKCKVHLYEHRNFKGQRITLSASSDGIILNLNNKAMNGGIDFNDKVSSIRIEKDGRRRKEEANLDMEVHDPLCEWILQDGIDTDWAIFTPEQRDMEVANLLEECGEYFEDDAKKNQCQFYVYAIGEVFDDRELMETMKFDPKEETLETEYMRCGLITNKLNSLIEQGKVDGVKG